MSVTSPRYRAVSPRRVHAGSGALESISNSARLAPLSARSEILRTNMSPRWHPPQLSPRISPGEVSANVKASAYVAKAPVVPTEWRALMAEARIVPVPPPPRPPVGFKRDKVAAAKAASEAAAAKAADEAAAVAKAAAETAAAVEAATAAEAEAERSEGSEEEDTEEEDEEEGGEDDFDEQMIMIQRQRGRGGGGGASRRMSLADMQGSDMLQGMSKLREQLSSVEVDEYRDFFDLVDKDRSNSIDKEEMKQVMQMMGLEAQDEQIEAMIGEVKDGDEFEMNFDEFLTLMAIYVGPRGDQQEAELKEAFNAIDLDGGGTIDLDELRDAFKTYGEGITEAELDKLVRQIDENGDGELDFDEFKELMLTALPPDADAEAKLLRRKARTTVRTLIMRQRMTDAFSAFDERYNFLRFSDASIIAAAKDQEIIRFSSKDSVSGVLEKMREKNVLSAPVYNDDELKTEPIGFVDMVEIVHLMLNALKLAFKLPASDPISIQMRLERITESASQFSNTPVTSVVERSWKPIRPGYSVFDVGQVLAKGVQRVPYCGVDGDLTYMITQSSFLAAFNEDPRIRLGGVGHVTVAELGGIKSLTMVTEMDMLMTAFEHLSTPVYAGAVPVVDSETGKLVWYISSDTLKLASESGRALGLSLSKPISDFKSNLSNSTSYRMPATCTPETPLRFLVKTVVESNAHRVWVVDEEGRPIGVVSLTNIIAAIMRSDKS